VSRFHRHQKEDAKGTPPRHGAFDIQVGQPKFYP
jgi:hypothetical protein